LHGFKDGPELTHVELSVEFIENLDKAAHMSAFKTSGQVHVHVDVAHRMLHPAVSVQDGEGIADVFDSNLIDIDVAMVGLILDVNHALLSCILASSALVVSG